MNEVRGIFENQLESLGKSWATHKHMHDFVRGAMRMAVNSLYGRDFSKYDDAERWAVECLERGAGQQLLWLRQWCDAGRAEKQLS